jgi:hypothetical protein
MDLIDAVLDDHREVRALFGRLRSAPDRDEKQDAWETLLRTLMAHEVAERNVVRPLVSGLRGGRRVGERRNREELRADRLMEKAQRLGVDDRRFDRRVGQLEAAVARHATREEQQEHGLLRECVPPHRLQRLAGTFQAAKDMTPLGR